MSIDLKTLWDYSKPVETRGRFLSLLKETEANSNLNDILEIKTQIARTYSLASEFDEAHRLLDLVEEELTDERSIAQIRYLLERGRTFNSANEKDKAKGLFIEAYALAEEKGADNYAIDAIHMVAIAAANFDEKLEWTEKGIQSASLSEDESVKGWIGVFYNNAGWDLFAKERYEEALVKFEACRDFHQERANEKSLAIANWSIAKTFRFLGKHDEALRIQTQNLADKGGEDPSGYTYEELAELYLFKGEEAAAKNYFSQAYAILSQDKWLVKNENQRIQRLLELSK